MTKTSGTKTRCASCGQLYNAGRKAVPKSCPKCDPGSKGRAKKKGWQ